MPALGVTRSAALAPALYRSFKISMLCLRRAPTWWRWMRPWSHWHPLINGYSGTFPLSYQLHAGMLRHPEERPDLAWSTLADSGATHAIVHENFYKDSRGKIVSQWLADHGARLVEEFDGDKIFSLR